MTQNNKLRIAVNGYGVIGKRVLGGIMNTMVPELEIPNHQGSDAKARDPELFYAYITASITTTNSSLGIGQVSHPLGLK